MSNIKDVLIIEDEQYAAERLKLLLSEIDLNLSVVKVLASIKDSVDFIKQQISLQINLTMSI